MNPNYSVCVDTTRASKRQVRVCEMNNESLYASGNVDSLFF